MRTRFERRAKDKLIKSKETGEFPKGCGKSKCGLCKPHKRWKNTTKYDKKSHILARIVEDDLLKELD